MGAVRVARSVFGYRRVVGGVEGQMGNVKAPETGMESQLKELLRDRGVSHRDRSYAGQLLGRHYREIGKFREAIEAFQGSSTE